MLHEIDHALLALRAALVARSVYGDDHPAIGEHETRAAELLTTVLAKVNPVVVLILGDLMTFQDQPLPSSAQLSATLGVELRRHGVECVSFQRGLSVGDLHDILDQIHAPAQDRPLLGRGGIRLGVIESGAAPGHARLPDDPSRPRSRWGHDIVAIESAWSSIYTHQGKSGGADHLVGVVANICTVVGTERSLLLPLAELKTHDEYTFVHTINVGLTAACLAHEAGFTQQEVHDIAISALLHDLGKKLVPSEILNKNGPLDERELREVRRHPVEGARLIIEAGDLPTVASIVAIEHHMNLDGTGYPAAPRRWQIHPASQVVHIADVFDALRTHRPYRRAMSLVEAVETMSKHSGVWFDKELFSVFVHRVAHRCGGPPAATAKAA
jgi:HD-GYP domain-containing protein (c-di-GMP phosphodiesterase class II)